jgi:hypothetical protein
MNDEKTTKQQEKMVVDCGWGGDFGSGGLVAAGANGR